MSFNILSQRTLLQKLLILFTPRYFYTNILHNYHLISKWRLLVDSHMMNIYGGNLEICVLCRQGAVKGDWYQFGWYWAPSKDTTKSCSFVWLPSSEQVKFIFKFNLERTRMKKVPLQKIPYPRAAFRLSQGGGKVTLLFSTKVSWATPPASMTSHSNGQEPRVACAN